MITDVVLILIVTACIVGIVAFIRFMIRLGKVDEKVGWTYKRSHKVFYPNWPIRITKENDDVGEEDDYGF